MTIEYDICRKKTGNATYSLNTKNGEEVVTKTIQVTYRIHVTDPADPNFGPADVDEEMVRNAPAPSVNPTFNNTLPKVADTVYESPDGTVYYWWRCTAVSVSRNSVNGTEFSASCTFTDTTGKEQGYTIPADPENIAPIITRSSEQHEVTAWTEDESYDSSCSPLFSQREVCTAILLSKWLLRKSSRSLSTKTGLQSKITLTGFTR
jgi:hypothetical protein